MIELVRPLRRIPRVRLDLEAGRVVLFAPRGRVKAGDVCLRVLDCFATPHTFESAMTALWRPEDGLVQWMRVSNMILALHRFGVLVDDGDARQTPSLTRGYAAAAVHIRMLNDVARTSAYLRAIAETVTADDVVVDIGTGTGILALAAARAGAKQVYAIERSGIADTAEAMFRDNALDHRIKVIRGWSTEVTLPERATVMVGELVGMDPFDEQIAEITADTKARHLRPNARMVPKGIRVFALPVTVPDGDLELSVFTSRRCRAWGDLYGFRFESLLSAQAETPLLLRATAGQASRATRLAPPVLVADLTFADQFSAEFSKEGDFQVATGGRLDGVLLFFELGLTDTVVLSTDPDIAVDTNHWGNRVVVLPAPVHVSSGDVVHFRLARKHGVIELSCSMDGGRHPVAVRTVSPEQPRKESR